MIVGSNLIIVHKVSICGGWPVIIGNCDLPITLPLPQGLQKQSIDLGDDLLVAEARAADRASTDKPPRKFRIPDTAQD